MCQVNGSLLVAPSFPPAGPGQPGSPPSSVLWGCYDFPLARTCSLMVSVAGPTCTSCVRGRRGAPGGFGGNPSGLEHLISRRSLTGVLHTWTHAGSRRFPGDPFHAFALLQDPGRADKISPWRSYRCCPRATQTEGLSGHIISRLTQGFSIRCLRFTSDVTVSHARLASGWRAAPLPGGGRTLWIASKGFRSHPILLSRTSPAAKAVYAKRRTANHGNRTRTNNR